MIVRNEVAKLYDEERHTLSSGCRPRPSPSEKVDPRPLEKPDSLPKFTELKNSIFTNLRVLILNVTIVFENSSPIIHK